MMSASAFGKITGLLASGPANSFTASGARRGSGLRVGGTYVLTADHCANGTDHTVVVNGRDYPATVALRGGLGGVAETPFHRRGGDPGRYQLTTAGTILPGTGK